MANLSPIHFTINKKAFPIQLITQLALLMRKTTLRYWICQILGWGGWPAINIFFVYLFANDMYLKPAEKKTVFFAILIIEFIWNILATHALRFGLKKNSMDKIINEPRNYIIYCKCDTYRTFKLLRRKIHRNTYGLFFG